MALSVADAQSLVLKQVQPPGSEPIPLREALSRVLASDVRAESDSPPFDKALMDGYAVRCADVRGPETRLRVTGSIMAGHVPGQPLAPGEAMQIMTGAPLPAGCDAVIKREETVAEGSEVRLTLGRAFPEMNLIRCGASLSRGTRILTAGTVLRTPQIGVLAELGCDPVSVSRRPVVSILATGDELVATYATPAPGQIRNSNETMLMSQMVTFGAEARGLGIAKDRLDELEGLIREGLQGDLLLLSGGVSAGNLDLVPAALTHCGVERVFHGVNVKPGKPIWFGIHVGTRPCLVFGLPGNPVSSMVCAELFVRPAIRALLGQTPAIATSLRAKFLSPFRGGGDRPTYHPVRIRFVDGELTAELVPWQGSSDLSATVQANGTALLPVGSRGLLVGDLVDVQLWDGRDFA